MNRKIIGFKDVILITLLAALCIGIQMLVLIPFIANIKLVLWVVGGIDMLLCGTIFVLMATKSPRTGTFLLFNTIMAIYYFITNGMILISALIFLIGIIMELVCLNNGYKSKIRLTIAYIIYGCGIMLSPVILIYSQKEQMIKTMLASGLEQSFIDNMFAVYSITNISIGLIVTTIGAIAGCYIGFNVLKKHFVTAGVIENEEL